MVLSSGIPARNKRTKLAMKWDRDKKTLVKGSGVEGYRPNLKTRLSIWAGNSGTKKIVQSGPKAPAG